MSWGKRTAPPDKNGKPVDTLRVCDTCIVGSSYVQSTVHVEAMQNNMGTCEGCGNVVNTVLWNLPQSHWVLLEVYLAKKEAEHGE